MKLVWKGIYKNKEQLPVGNLPDHAIKFKEPNSMITLNIVAALFIVPVIILIGFALFLKGLLIEDISLNIGLYSLLGGFLAFLMIIPHEFLHAIAFPKETEVELWISPMTLTIFVVSTAPISKGRFIFLSLLPNLIFGLLPLLIWMFLPNHLIITDITFAFAVVSLLFGVGDYLNVFNATFQMPKGSIQQLSGINSYWYMPK